MTVGQPTQKCRVSSVRRGEKDGARQGLLARKSAGPAWPSAPHLVERAAIELRCVDRRQIDHRQLRVELVVDDLATKAVGKASDCRLSSRNRSIAAAPSDRQSADPTFTIVPRLRTRIRFSADIMPCTCPR